MPLPSKTPEYNRKAQALYRQRHGREYRRRANEYMTRWRKKRKKRKVEQPEGMGV